MQRQQGLPLPSSSQETWGQVNGERGYQEYVSLMQQCLSFDPERRPGFRRIAAVLDDLVKAHQTSAARESSSRSDAAPSTSLAGSSANCAICFERQGNAAFLHCDASGRTTSHGGYCEECAERHFKSQRDPTCPTCRQRITGILHQQFG